jgi:hypothetical protein
MTVREDSAEYADLIVKVSYVQQKIPVLAGSAELPNQAIVDHLLASQNCFILIRNAL